MQSLISYESSEHWTHISFDHTLIGLMDIISVILENNPAILSFQDIKELAEKILTNCLLNEKFIPIDEHITSQVDLDTIMRPKINKCLSKESMISAFNLLLTLCRVAGDGSLPLNILEHYQ